MKPALLLNASFEPLEIISWKRSVTIVYSKQKAMAIETHDEQVSSGEDDYDLPSVVRLNDRVQLPKRPVPFNKINVFHRDEFKCQYCGEEFDYKDLTFDHVLPQSRGGETTWENITTSCGPCNHSKGNRTPEEADMTLLSDPKEPKWMPFSISRHNHGFFSENWTKYLWT
jgi:5-methylcytosine-specific restriction endonuclease McrA